MFSTTLVRLICSLSPCFFLVSFYTLSLFVLTAGYTVAFHFYDLKDDGVIEYEEVLYMLQSVNAMTGQTLDAEEVWVI